MRNLGRMAFGGDYNPEQWPRETWADDLRLMRRAGVTMMTVGVFSWALLEPREDDYDFGWLDDVLDGLHGAGIAIDLATATASPPPWLTTAHPEILPVTADGTRLWPGGRQSWCPSSDVFRAHAVRLVDRMATRYGDHPGLALWHVGNEFGAHNAHCYCDVSAAAFRGWLRERYGRLTALNDAWGTAFWSQRYSDWEQILPPRQAPAIGNPTQALDFRRFSSDALLAHYRAERDVLRRHTPDVPVTTNFMAMWAQKDLDYWSWASEVDIVTNDHYLRAGDEDAHVELALSADISRGLAGGDTWLLMEHSTSAVNWQPRNVAKQPGEMLRNSMQHVARGSDGAMFFQWRASRAGAEKYHSALVPHAGEDTSTFREVCDLGAALAALAPLVGAAVQADVALVFDWQAWWACDAPAHPTVDLGYYDTVLAVYTACWHAGVTVDVVAPGAPLTDYDVVLVPTLHLVTDDAATVIAERVAAGATALITCFSGIVDEHDHVRLGGYPGAFRELVGVVVEEFHPLRRAEAVTLDDGSRARVWTERVRLRGAEAVAHFTDGPVPQGPAVTRAGHGEGSAWYLATQLDQPHLDGLVQRVLDEAGVQPVLPRDGTAPPAGVEAVRRVALDGSVYCVVINHTEQAVPLNVDGHDLLREEDVRAGDALAAGAVMVVRT